MSFLTGGGGAGAGGASAGAGAAPAAAASAAPALMPAIGGAAKAAGSSLFGAGKSLIGSGGGPGAGGMGPPAPSTGMTGFGQGFLRGFTSDLVNMGGVGPTVDFGQFAGRLLQKEAFGGSGGGGGGTRIDDIAALVNLLNGKGRQNSMGMRRQMFMGR